MEQQIQVVVEAVRVMVHILGATVPTESLL
jgi:hypothetical protein